MIRNSHYPYFIVAVLSAVIAVSIISEQDATSAKNSAIIPMPKIEDDFYDWYDRHEAVKAYIKSRPVDLVFIGDSITHMFGGMPPSSKPFGAAVWEKYYSGRNAVNMGFGWDRTQNALYRLQNGGFEGIAPKIVVVLIGTNNLEGTENARQNSPDEIAEGIESVCELIHEKSPLSKIVLLGLLPRRTPSFAEPILETNDRIARLGNRNYIHFLNMHDAFVGSDGLAREELMRDSVHPNEAGYQRWAELMEPVLKEFL